MRFAVLLLLLLGAAVVRGVAVVPSAVFNEMMGSWRQAPATFEDPNLGSVRTVNSSEVTGLERIGATLVFITLKACTAQAPNWHPNADEFMYIVKGDGLERNVVWNGRLYTSVLKQGDVQVTPQGLLHSAVNPTCGDVEYIAIFNTASVVTEKAVPALLKMPQSSEYFDLGGFGAFLDANPSPPSGAIYALGGNCSQLCADNATAAPATNGGSSGPDRFAASLSNAPVAVENEHGSHRLLTAAEIPALADVKKGASFSFTTIKNCSFPSPHYMPHANKVTLPVAGAVNVSVLANGSQLYSHELGTTGDFFILPKSDLFSLSNELCRDAQIVAYWDTADAAKTYPLAELALFPEDQLAGAFGVEGSPALEPAEEGAFWPFDAPACSERCSRGG